MIYLAIVLFVIYTTAAIWLAWEERRCPIQDGEYSRLDTMDGLG